MDLEQGTDPWSICPGNDCWNDQLEYYDALVNYVYAIPLYARFMNYDISETLGLVHYF